MSISILKKDFDLNSIDIDTEDAFKHLKDFLTEDASQYIKHKLCSIYWYFLWEKIIWYITISTTSLKIRNEHLQSLWKMPDWLDGITFPIPCILIWKLLVSNSNQNKWIGSELMYYIMAYCFELSRSVWIRFIYVDSNKKSVWFYERFGFIPIETKHRSVSMVFDLNLYEDL